MPQRRHLRTVLWLRSADRLPESPGGCLSQRATLQAPGLAPLANLLSASGLCAGSSLSNRSESALTFKTEGHVKEKEKIPSHRELVTDKAVSLTGQRQGRQRDDTVDLPS